VLILPGAATAADYNAASMHLRAATFALALAGCLNRCEPGGAESDAEAPADAQASADARAIADAQAAAALAPAAQGDVLYATYCAHCHGQDAEGYAADEAPALANDDLLAIATDDYLRDAILEGRPGTTMSAWGRARGGPLGPAEAQAIVSHLRTKQTAPTEALGVRAMEGVASRGAPIYAARCASCHGKKGAGGRYAALANPALLASASDAFLAATIERGRRNTPMPSFAGALSPQAIDDVVALLRSWQVPVDDDLDLPPRPGALRDVVIHPRGPKPRFEPGADFVPVDVVKTELSRGATMIIADARAPGDYARMHVAGAISLPFYEVEAYAKELPKDRAILTYCACPHASSVKARDALRALGFANVAVLDEGILAWRDRGYPVRGGAKP
jgi:cytochrome c oxidase cbb3-type subunit III